MGKGVLEDEGGEKDLKKCFQCRGVMLFNLANKEIKSKLHAGALSSSVYRLRAARRPKYERDREDTRYSFGKTPLSIFNLVNLHLIIIIGL
jgi:hypothetical protein